MREVSHGYARRMADVRSTLLRLELALAQRRVADLPGGDYEAVIHPDYHETGASGRWWTRRAVLETLLAASPTDVAVEEFAVEELAPGVILATYVTPGVRPARRASVWVLDGDRWRIRFHQGTLF
jgi:hypothetical protein